jgi:hypothetical protein
VRHRGGEEARASVGEALSHSLDFAIVLSHFMFFSVILCFPQPFYDFLSHFVSGAGVGRSGGRGARGRGGEGARGRTWFG